MKTVIIYRKSSQATLDRYQILFQPYLDSKQIAFCFWDENASDFASALSDLSTQIRGEKEWRAIVALPVSDDPDDEWSKQCREDNPFDFLCNSAAEPEQLESSIPLIVLAQMLGGVPLTPPEHRVDMVADQDDPCTVRLTVHDENQERLARLQAEWQRLSDQYSTQCVLPSSLYLFVGKTKSAISIPTDTDKAILERHESDSSMFWYRNCYPHNARFLMQHSSYPYNAQFHEDTFKFWMTALTLAINDFPTGTFEAYKLYDVQSIVPRDSIHQTLSDYHGRLDTIRHVANLQIQELQRDIQWVRGQDFLPNYQILIPVQYPQLTNPDLFVESDKIGLANDCPIDEESWWYKAVRLSRKTLNRVFTSILPVLDRACTSARFQARVTEEQYVELDEYQFAEMEAELSDLEKEILSFTRSNVLPIRTFNKRLDTRKKETATRMRKRMSKQRAIIAGGIALAAYFVGFIPDIIRQCIKQDSPMIVFGIALAGTLLMALTAIASLFWYRRGTIQKIGNYNGTMRQILTTTSESASHFSQYLSKCCAYMRGKSILYSLEKKTMVAIKGISQMSNHIDHLKVYIGIVESWLNDFDLIPLKRDGYANSIAFDFDIPPEHNKEYLLSNEDVSIKIPSVGGSMCNAPYLFVTKFDVKRVPVFESAPASFAKNGEEKEEE